MINETMNVRCYLSIIKLIMENDIQPIDVAHALRDQYYLPGRKRIQHEMIATDNFSEPSRRTVL